MMRWQLLLLLSLSFIITNNIVDAWCAAANSLCYAKAVIKKEDWGRLGKRTTTWQRGTARDDDPHTTRSKKQTPPALLYRGPVLKEDPCHIVAGVSLGELGLDLFVAPSTVVPHQLGLFVMLSEDTQQTTLPALTLLCGYSRSGTFATKDKGDKTVGFTMASAQTAVFYEQKLMSILDALELAATTHGSTCGLAGHILDQDDGEITICADNNPDFPRYFVPALMNQEDENDNDDDALSNISVQNFGQFCNDLAWNYDNPPNNRDEYTSESEQRNVVQLVWRLEFDATTHSLIPSWPVSVLARDVTFDNADELYELGTQYGWTYWQATVMTMGLDNDDHNS